MKWLAFFLLFLNMLVAGTSYVEWKKANGKKVFQGIDSRSGAPLLLLTELQVPDPGAGNIESKGKRCALIGPLETRIDAEEWVEQLSESDLQSGVYTNSVQLAPEYWVYLPAFNSRKDALEMLSELKERKIDSFLISQGALRNGISLGFFRNSDTAEVLLKRRKKQGLDAQLKLVPKEKTEFWVLINSALDADLQALLRRIFPSKDVISRSREISC